VINETRERFVRTILERIPVERIVEVHFFPGIRQGQVETGVAVIAVTPPDLESGPDAVAPPAELALEPFEQPAERTVVYTAAYRWTRKGPDRGKWVVEVIAEADAPLATVETVVRGVQLRAGEALDAHRMTAADLKAMIATDTAFAPVGSPVGESLGSPVGSPVGAPVNTPAEPEAASA